MTKTASNTFFGLSKDKSNYKYYYNALIKNCILQKFVYVKEKEREKEIGCNDNKKCDIC